MNKNVYIRTTLYLLLTIVCLYRGNVPAQPDYSQRKIGVDKKNPFIKLPEEEKETLISQKTNQKSFFSI